MAVTIPQVVVESVQVVRSAEHGQISVGKCFVTVVKMGYVYESGKSLRSGDVTRTEGSTTTVTLRQVGVHVSETERYPSAEKEQQFRSAGKCRRRKETIECGL